MHGQVNDCFLTPSKWFFSYCSFIYFRWCQYLWLGRNWDVRWHLNLILVSDLSCYLCHSLCTKIHGLIEPTKSTKIGIQRIKSESHIYHDENMLFLLWDDEVYFVLNQLKMEVGRLWWLMLHSTIFQLYKWRKPEYQEKEPCCKSLTKFMT